MNSATGYSLAHLTDLHLPPPRRELSLTRLSAKQMLALLSWHRKRHRVHTLLPATALVADLTHYAPDHAVVTGDLINLAMPEEFLAARRWLERLGSAERVSFVPGNHDLTAAVPWPEGLGQWDAWMTGDGRAPRAGAASFPFLRRRGPLAIIGLSSAITTPVFSAAGALGEDQIDRLGPLLEQTGREGLFRVVLIHHPPVIGEGGRRKALRDRASLATVLLGRGAELVLHGHHHRTRVVSLPGPGGPIPVFEAPAALASIERPEIAGWHLHRIARQGAGWNLTTIARTYDPAVRDFRQTAEWTHVLPQAG